MQQLCGSFDTVDAIPLQTLGPDEAIPKILGTDDLTEFGDE